MHSVLIIDDEEPVLDSYQHMVNTCTDDFRVVAKGRSGQEAIVLLYEHQPDVVFMDILMPGMDGLSAIEEVHARFPQTVFVLSTAYERFDLAQRAIPLGVFRYLVKPISKKDFLDTLEAVRGVLDQRSPKRPSADDEGVQRFLKQELWSEFDDDRWNHWRRELHLGSSQGRVAFLGADADQDRLFAAALSHLSFRYRVLFAPHFRLGLFFVSGETSDGQLEAEFGRLVADHLPAGTVSFWGVGSLRTGPAIRWSCREALDRVNAVRNRADLRLRERMRVEQLRRKVGLSAFEEVQSLFEAYADEVFGAYSWAVAQAKMVALFTLLFDSCFAPGTADDPTLVFDPAEEIMSLTDAAAWSDWSVPAFRDLCLGATQRRMGGLPLPLVKAIGYIEERFDQQIQLADVAEAACVSAAYLSRLFGDHMESSFVEYLTQLRVEKAEKLIREHRLNIKEVSAQVGYQDPNYFSKIFRKVVGISPSLYAQGTSHE